MRKSAYLNSPIRSIESLAKLIGISSDKLLELAENADRHYFPNEPDIKENGKVRQTYRVSPKLEYIQKRINKKIFNCVDFSPFLLGSIKERDHALNATKHLGQAFIYHEDITDFFPSVKISLVKELWHYFFNFSEPVASVLAKLTTYNGLLPQGAPTSSYIANLVFWENEPELDQFCRQKGYVYTRFVDDIAVSSDRLLSESEQKELKTEINNLLRSKNFRPNWSKRKIETKARRMVVTGLNVNSEMATLSRPKRNRIRAAVFQCERTPIQKRNTYEYRKLFESTWGRVEEYARFHPNKGKEYLARLERVKPQTENLG